jgi:hypothetical protein
MVGDMQTHQPRKNFPLNQMSQNICEQSRTQSSDSAIADLTTIAFYYSLHVGDYTVKRNINETRHMVQFKMEDIIFFKKDNKGRLRCEP